MSDFIELIEYETAVVELSQPQAQRLATRGKSVITVQPAGQTNHYSITAHNLVGTLVVDDLRLLIRPKIRPENLFLLLEVGLDEHAWRQEAFDYAKRADLLPSVIAFYARTLETTLARGLLRSYRPEGDRLIALRGRIDTAAQFRQAGVALPVACRFEEHTPDIAENRYLKAATRLALRVPGVDSEDRRRLLQQVASLEDVADGFMPADYLDQIAITRLNVHYQPALRLARLLLENLTLADQRGQHAASSFVVDMNRLFENFVTQRLRRALKGHLEVRDQVSNNYLDTRQQVPIRPDLVFRRQGHEVYVADIKYKLTDDARARTSDYYQLLAYATALDLPEGALVYCLADGGQPERTITVRHVGKLLHTLAIDLSGPPTEVAAEIAKAATWIKQRVREISPLTAPVRKEPARSPALV
ncbi:McrC family protein [Candidatus Poriferisocius sp.]|uniref:McrC family protein n=1 Tax=Candidatus Poriferisocius sp. TaxID=3101276 RepID=UPI003B52F47C